ncbi:MAG TPA: DUF3386 family protein [Isosphaeraceae bacterium]|nr:DUF3386 family protein [Isosphaeraceae bacterium]
MNRQEQVGRRLRIAVGLAAAVVMGWAAEARAHFLFIRIGTQAEAGRAAEVYFSEQAEAGDPRFIAKVAHTQLWVQARPGAFRALAVHPGVDRLRAALPADRSLVVVGQCQYGVLARPKQTPFLLRYYPKAVAGVAEELNRMIPRREIPFEIQATFEGGGAAKADADSPGGVIRLAALRNGRPIPGAVFTAIDSALTETTVKAGPDGSAAWTPPEPGRYSLYVKQTLPQPGTLAGTAYDEIREFATLALTWPLERRQADPEAVALFQEALAHRAAWRNFPGFSAEIHGWLDGRVFGGSVTVAADGTVEIRTDDPAAKPWLQDQLDSMVMHRLPTPPGDSSASQGPRLQLVDEPDEHPLGRLIAVEGGRMASSYRIKDRQILVVNRRMGNRNMTITIVDNQTNPDGHFLPHSYVVQYWDAATGRLQSTETIQERWQRVGAWDLPAMHSVLTASDAGLSVRSVRFSKPELRKRTLK